LSFKIYEIYITASTVTYNLYLRIYRSCATTKIYDIDLKLCWHWKQG